MLKKKQSITHITLSTPPMRTAKMESEITSPSLLSARAVFELHTQSVKRL